MCKKTLYAPEHKKELQSPREQREKTFEPRRYEDCEEFKEFERNIISLRVL